jgi:hypothetical protein
VLCVRDFTEWSIHHIIVVFLGGDRMESPCHSLATSTCCNESWRCREAHVVVKLVGVRTTGVDPCMGSRNSDPLDTILTMISRWTTPLVSVSSSSSGTWCWFHHRLGIIAKIMASGLRFHRCSQYGERGAYLRGRPR